MQVKILDSRAKVPEYATSGSAGFDLRACIDKPITINPGETIMIGTGLSIHISDPTYAGFITPRSGLGHKHGIILGNTVGVIDSDYTGEVKLSCWNRGKEPYTISVGERIAQLVLVRVAQVKLEVVDEFNHKSERGSGGFGHTGK
jgi:dUTP pyrophosphatase